MRLRPWLLSLVIAVVALLVGLELAVRAVSLEGNRPRIERRLTESLGLGVTLGGDLYLSLLPEPRIEATDVKVANLPGRPSPYLLEVGRLELGFALFPLLLGEVTVHSLALADVDLHVEPDESGHLEAPPELGALTEQERPEDPGELVPLQVHHLLVEDLRLVYRDDAAGVVTSAHFTRVEVEEEDLDAALEVELAGEYDGGAFEIEGVMGTIQEFLWTTQPYPVSLRGDLFDARFEVDGTVDAPTRMEGLDLVFALQMLDAGRRFRDAGVALPLIGPLRATGRLTGSSDELGLEDFEVVSLEPDQPIGGRVAGTIGNLQEVTGVSLDVVLETSDLSFFEPMIGRPLGQIDGVAIQAVVSDGDGSLGLESGLIVARAGEGAVSLEMNGRYDNLLEQRDLDVTLDLRATDVAVLGRLAALERPLPAVGPVLARGRVREVAGAIGIEDLALEIGSVGGPRLVGSGRVRDFARLAGVQLVLEFRDPDPRRFASYLDRELPDIGPVEGSFELSDSDGTLGLEHFELHGGRPELLVVDVTAEFDDLFAYDDIDIQVDLRARDLAVIGSLIAAELPPIAPVTFKGSVSGANELLRTRGNARLGESRFTGDGEGSFATDARPHIKARLRSDHVRLRDVGFLPDEPGRAVALGPDELPPQDNLPLEQLRVVDLDLSLDLARVTGRAGFDMSKARLRVHLDDGDLQVRDFSAAYEGGALEGSLRVNVRTNEPTITALLDATNVDLERLNAQFQVEAARSGVLDMALNLGTRGRTLEEQRRNLQGYVGIMLREGTLAARYARMFVLNLSRAAFSRLPGSNTDAPRVGCFRAELVVEDGVAEVDQLVIAGNDVSVAGTGSIDVGRDQLDLTFVPSTRNPALIGVAATVRVTGPIADPTIRPVARSLVTSAARGVMSNLLRPPRAAGSSLRRVLPGGGPEPEQEPGPCDVPLPRQRR